ncbi:MAG: ATP-binding protein, partial [Sinomicrobium sp.]|nr:ATP-binding protein [Sinomicrobium sp.]
KEKELNLLKEQQKNRRNTNLLIGAAGVLILGGVIALLLQNNTTKKRKIAEQQQQLEKQKVETLIKEQELLSIDAMIAGQEKERLRVANELHDDLGSLMATVKLHFDNIKANKEDPALQHTHRLLDQAYQKIRGISHAKNSGVLAAQGLLPAVQKMAKNISAANTLAIEVFDFGLENRMENSLELTIFRIIQELVTNIIKHAEATKADIQLTQHKDSLNIIIEDNGKGFDVSKMKTSDKGMGLHSIEKRVEHLEGDFTIESIMNRGTTIIIDIPT